MSRCHTGLLALVIVGAACGGGDRPRAENTASIIAAKSDFALYRVDPRSGKSTRLASDTAEAQDSEPACSPDGERLAFVRETVDRTELRLLDLDDGESRPLHRIDIGFASPAWAPDGRRLTYTDSVNGLRLLETSTGRVTVLSRESDAHATWSPDGNRLAFEHDRSGNGDTSIWTMAADGQERRELTHPSGEDADHKPIWSPDGALIAFERPYHVWVVDTRTGQERLLAKRAEILAWSPDSRELLVNELRDLGRTGMYAVPIADAGEPRLVTRGLWTEACWQGG